MINSTRKKIEDDIKLAIELLKSQEQKVTVAKIASLSGVPLANVYYSKHARLYVRPSKKKAKSPVKEVQRDKVSPTVASYVEYILDNYFVHAESLCDVQKEMSVEVESFNRTTFNLAVSNLERDGKLIKSSLPGRYIAAPQPVPAVTVKTEEPNPKPELKPAVEPECYELNYQLPLSKGVLKISMPSVMTGDDKEFVKDWWEFIARRRLRK